MKAKIHPEYHEDLKITCACGNVIVAGSTRRELKTEICSACHPFYTGKQKLIDTAGRVDKFMAKVKKAQKIKEKKVEVVDEELETMFHPSHAPGAVAEAPSAAKAIPEEPVQTAIEVDTAVMVPVESVPHAAETAKVEMQPVKPAVRPATAKSAKPAAKAPAKPAKKAAPAPKAAKPASKAPVKAAPKKAAPKKPAKPVVKAAAKKPAKKSR